MSQPTNRTTNESGGIVEVTEDERHRLLSAERRRAVVDVLTAETSPFGLRELAAEVGRQEDGVDPDDESVERIAVTLHHAHLPVMAAIGVVAYDPERRRVEPRSGLTAI